MEMTLRWYGTGFDTVTLKEIRQIPGVTGVITTLYDTKPGEVWSRERIRALKQEVEGAGLHISGIESVNVHDAIKTGAADRDVYIGRYIETLENLGQEDIHLVCYNFMPVFDWTRTELARLRPDGSTVLAYTQEAVDRLDPELEALGYQCMGEFGIPGRRYFRKGGDHRTHQLHVFQAGDRKNILRHLAVRGYLRACPAEREAYGALKRWLAGRYPEDIEGYCDGKDAFVRALERRALDWYDEKRP